MNLQLLLQRMDKGGTGPCGQGWVGTKPNCKRSIKKSPEELAKLNARGAKSAATKKRTGATKSIKKSPEELAALNERGKKAATTKKTKAEVAGVQALGKPKAAKAGGRIAELKQKLGVNPDNSKQSAENAAAVASAKKSVAKKAAAKKGAATRKANTAAKRAKQNAEMDKILDSLDYGLNLDSLMKHEDSLYPVTYLGETYHLDAADYVNLVEALNLDADGEEDMEDDEETMDSYYADMDEEDDPDEMEPDGDADDEEMAPKSKRKLPPEFIKNAQKMKNKADSLAAENAMLKRLLARQDEEMEEAEEEEKTDSDVRDRVTEIMTAYQDAADFLPSDFQLDSVTSAIDVYRAAVLNFDADLEADDEESPVSMDSDEAVLGAYKVIRTYAGRPSPAVRNLRTAVDSANGAHTRNPETRSDSTELRPLTYRSRNA